MNGKLVSFPYEVEPETRFAELPLSPYDLLFQSIINLYHNPCHNQCAIGFRP